MLQILGEIFMWYYEGERDFSTIIIWERDYAYIDNRFVIE